MVAVDSGRGQAVKGSAVLSPAGRERSIDLRGLRLRAESAARRHRRTGRTPAYLADFRELPAGPLSAAPADHPLNLSQRLGHGAGILALGLHIAIDEFDHRHGGVVALAKASLEHPYIAAGALGVTWAQGG